MQINRKKVMWIIAAVMAIALVGLILFTLVIRPAFFDSEKYDMDDVVTIVAETPKDGYHVEAGEEVDASLYKISAAMKGGENVDVDELPLKISVEPELAPSHGHDFTVKIVARSESGKEYSIEINTLIDREVSEEYDVGLYDPESVKAVVYRNGDLEIHGTGNMKNYTSGLLPWEDNDIQYLTWIDDRVSIETMDYWFEGNDEFIGAKCKIPESVKTMVGCFEGCSRLTEAPDFSSANSLVDMTDCFSGCSSLQKVGALPANLKTADRTFYECTSLIYGADVSNSTMVESMNECYAGDVSLVQSVTPDSVKYMESCYEGCINLKEGNIPANVKDIESAWAGCSSLEKVAGEIPKRCEGKEEAFEGCRMMNRSKLRRKEICKWSAKYFQDNGSIVMSHCQNCEYYQSLGGNNHAQM